MESDITRLNQKVNIIDRNMIELSTSVLQHSEKMKVLERIALAFDGFADFKRAVWTHIDEGERPGGMRDKIKDLEHSHVLCSKTTTDRIARIERTMWKTAVVSGIVVGLIFKGVPELLKLFITIL